MVNKIHIGRKIKEQLLLKKFSVTEFAEKINCSPRNVYKIFGKASIDTDLLVQISNALELNFFACYVAQEGTQSFLINTNNKQEALVAIA